MSTISRFFATHSSYLMLLSEVTVAIRSVRSFAPAGELAAVTVMYSFSGLLRCCQ